MATETMGPEKVKVTSGHGGVLYEGEDLGQAAEAAVTGQVPSGRQDEDEIDSLVDAAVELAEARSSVGSREKVGVAKAFKRTEPVRGIDWDFTITVKVDGKPAPPEKDGPRQSAMFGG